MTRPTVTTSIPGQIDLIKEVIVSFPRGRILDLGTGSGLAARQFHQSGWDVTATGFDLDAYLDAPLPEGICVLPDVDICDLHQFGDAEFDAIWCAHVLEHVSNTGLALDELRRVLRSDGWLFIAVPPYKDRIVGGHVNSGWNLGSLMYVLADAGFGLAQGRFIHHGYNVFAMVQRGPGRLPAGVLRRANGDIEVLAEAGRFPEGFSPRQGFNGRRHSVNWLWNHPPEAIPARRSQLASPPPIAPMRIGFFVPWITKGKGGTENVGQMMANAMAKRGHEVTIFTFDDKRAPSRWPLDDRIALVHLPEAEDERADQQMAVDVSSRNFDILVGLHMDRAMLRYVRCAHKVGLPLVLSEPCVDPRFSRWIGNFSLDERDIAMAGATLIHLPLDEFVETLAPSVRGRTRIIPNTIREPEALANPGVEKSRYTLLTTSELAPHRNPSLVIEAFARLTHEFPEWRLQIVGDGPLRRQLEVRAQTLGINDRVDFAGEGDDVYPYYADADLFAIPTSFEDIPLTLCEAMAHGLPAVGFDNCVGASTQIISGRTGLLCNGDDQVRSLVRALRRLMADAALRDRMGRAARSAFEKRFRNDVVHHAWEEMFAEARELLANRKKPDLATITAVRLWERVWGL
ncbi:glycosyltransferase [Mycoplana ramosa]|uniref:Glycosyltransferase n=1 Tax=Mycoplana ramosa TaxID=40837 RepID=A0ABW3Z136_MYCRA